MLPAGNLEAAHRTAQMTAWRDSGAGKRAMCRYTERACLESSPWEALRCSGCLEHVPSRSALLGAPASSVILPCGPSSRIFSLCPGLTWEHLPAPRCSPPPLRSRARGREWKASGWIARKSVSLQQAEGTLWWIPPRFRCQPRQRGSPWSSRRILLCSGFWPGKSNITPYDRGLSAYFQNYVSDLMYRVS